MNDQVSIDRGALLRTAQERVLVAGRAEAPLCATRNMISFWGGYDPSSGVIIDRHHPLNEENLTGRIFALPKGKGSSTGSAVLLDALPLGSAKVQVPTSINAISIDRKRWKEQNIDPEFAGYADRLATAFEQMGAKPIFSCTPYVFPETPKPKVL